MSATCCVCSSNITKERFPGVKCGGSCGKLFHIKCAGISDEILVGIKSRSANWLCEDCRSTANQSIVDCDDDTNCESEIRLVDIMRQLKRMEKKLATLDELRVSIKNLKNDNQVLQSRVQQLEEQIAAHDFKLHTMEADYDKPNQLRNVSTIAITGLPSKHGDVRGVIVNTLAKIEVPVQPDDIEFIEEVNRSKKTLGGNRNSSNNILQSLFIVKLKSIELKENIISQMRKKKSLSTNDLDVILPANHPAQRIYIMHHFTKFQSQLYREAKNIKNEFNYKFLWCKAGQIYLRKMPESNVHRIHSMNDIFRLRCNDHPVD